jgi:metallo-beta-lactamase family protein
VATLQFLGATGTVTGSKYLLEHDGCRVLVDCGLFQGLKELRLRNWNPPPFDPASLSLVLLTHAHLDHSGYLPVVVRNGYQGRILATAASRDLSEIILLDSGHLQEEDARYANKKGFSKHHPALPLYTQDDARRVIPQIESVAFDASTEIGPGLTATLRAAGHIPGAAMIEIRIRSRGEREKVVIFSGDLGRPDQPILPDPESLRPCDHLLLESTYGNRDHPKDNAKADLARIVNETIGRGGTLLIPSFAVGRAQHLLYLLHQLREEGSIRKDIPIHLDSPMAIEASRILVRHKEAQDEAMRAEDENGGDPLGLKDVHFSVTVEDSKVLNNTPYPSIIVSASGMAEGGRILHHLAVKASDHRTTVLFVGFQAVGTRGRAMQGGAEFIRLYGREIPVRARVETLQGLSAHADRGEILAWLRASGVRPGRVHLVHGEPDARDALAALLRETMALDVHCPDYLERIEL